MAEAKLTALRRRTQGRVPARAKGKAGSLADFEVLVRKVRETILFGQQKIEQAKVETYWQTGKFINEHILLNKERAELGYRTIKKLAERVGVDQSVLQRCKQFAEKYPVFATWQKLTWSHFRLLIPIEDDKLRSRLTDLADEKGWSTDRLETEIRARLGSGKSEAGPKQIKSAPDSGLESASLELLPEKSRYQLLEPKLGVLYTFALKRTAADGLLKINQGFSVYQKEWQTRGAKLAEGDIVESERRSEGVYAAVKSTRTADALYTYRAQIERVVDADTLFVEIDLGFATTTRQYLRLRALDAREMNTEEGKEARAFVAAALKDAPFVILTSSRSDKFDRYLADVFVPGKKFLNAWEKGNASLDPAGDLLFLNNELLRRRLAVRVKY